MKEWRQFVIIFFYHILINVFEPLVATETNFHMKHNLLHYDKDYHNITYRYVITLLGTSTCSRFVPLVIRKPKDKLTEYKGTCDIIPTQCIIYTCIYTWTCIYTYVGASVQSKVFASHYFRCFYPFCFVFAITHTTTRKSLTLDYMHWRAHICRMPR